MKYKTVMGVAVKDIEAYPDVQVFDDALNKAVRDGYEPVWNTFRVQMVPNNTVFIMITKEKELKEPYIGGPIGL